MQDLIRFDYLGQKQLFRKYTRYTVIIRVDLGQTFFYKNASFFQNWRWNIEFQYKCSHQKYHLLKIVNLNMNLGVIYLNVVTKSTSFFLHEDLA